MERMGIFPRALTQQPGEQGAGGPHTSPEVCGVSVAALSSHKDSVLLSALTASECGGDHSQTPQFLSWTSRNTPHI